MNPQGSSLARFQIGCRRPSACPSTIEAPPPTSSGRCVDPRFDARETGCRPDDPRPHMQSNNMAHVGIRTRQASGRQGIRNPQFPKENRVSSAARPTISGYLPVLERVIPEGVEPPFPLCKRGVVAIGPRDDARLLVTSSSTGGSRTHRHQTLEPDRYANSRTVPSIALRQLRHSRLIAGPGVEPRHPSL